MQKGRFTSNRFEEVLQKDTLKVYMPAEIKAKIELLCQKIRTIEWSGILVYDIVGDLQKPKDCKIELKDIVPMDKGSSAYTTYKLDPKVVMSHYMARPEHEDFFIGHIHSHHNMGVFFSGTDTDELHENAPNHNVYLSLIVNNKNEWACKLVHTAEVQDTMTYLDQNGEEVVVGDATGKKKLVVYDCEVVEEPVNIELDSHFLEGVARIDVVKPVFTGVQYGSANPRLGFPRRGHENNVASNGYQRNTGGVKRWWEQEDTYEEELAEEASKNITESDINSYNFAMECLTLSKQVDHIHGIADIADSLAQQFPTMSIPAVMENINERVVNIYINVFKDNQLIDFDTNISDVIGELNDAILEVTSHRGRVLLENFKSLLLQLTKSISHE